MEFGYFSLELGLPVAFVVGFPIVVVGFPIGLGVEFADGMIT